MAARFCLLALVFIVAAGSGTLFTGPSQFVEASFLDKIGNATKVFEQMTCPSEHRTAIDVCHSLTFPFYGLQAGIIENDRPKLSCCSRLVARNCMSLVTKTFCGETCQYISSFTTVLNTIIDSEQCQNYQQLNQCTQPGFLILLVVLVIVCITAVIILIIGIFNFLCD